MSAFENYAREAQRLEHEIATKGIILGIETGTPFRSASWRARRWIAASAPSIANRTIPPTARGLNSSA